MYSLSRIVSLSVPLVFPISVRILVSLSSHSCLGLCSWRCVFLLLSRSPFSLMEPASREGMCTQEQRPPGPLWGPHPGVTLRTLRTRGLGMAHSVLHEVRLESNQHFRLVLLSLLGKSSLYLPPFSISLPRSSKLILKKRSEISSHGSAPIVNKL